MELKRNCPLCGKEIMYAHATNFRTAQRKRSKCFECAMNERRSYKGNNNPFYGKTHTDEARKKIGSFNSKERMLSDEFLQTARENLAKISNNRPLYDIWLEKCGKEEADRKLDNFRKKQSENNKGEKNNMFGKPAPQGSGNGWSGWYKDWYFRSLRELSYMINVIERNGLKWETPDKSYKIAYQDYSGQTRTYFPDFIIDGSRVVEIKPKKLHNTPKVLAKKQAAEEFCHKLQMSYEIIDPPILTEEEIKQLYINGQVKFLDKYNTKFRERYLKC